MAGQSRHILAFLLSIPAICIVAFWIWLFFWNDAPAGRSHNVLPFVFALAPYFPFALWKWQTHHGASWRQIDGQATKMPVQFLLWYWAFGLAFAVGLGAMLLTQAPSETLTGENIGMVIVMLIGWCMATALYVLPIAFAFVALGKWLTRKKRISEKDNVRSHHDANG